jgi:UDP-2,4-diacetamido-2,4,6-trideoxy-beta-L-altropyranose hydrolase
MDLLVRADAGARSGVGHLMRCLALAAAWRRRGGSVTFLSRCEAPELGERVERGGHRFDALAAQYPDPADLDATLAMLGTLNDPWIVADGYHFDGVFHQRLRQAGYRVLVVDDHVRLPRYHADVLVNQNIYAEALEPCTDSDTQMLLGTCYALLRPEFVERTRTPRAIPPVARRVLVMLGGGDLDNVTARVVQALRQSSLAPSGGRIDAVVVVGAANPHRRQLEDLVAAAGGSVQLVRDPPDMAELMAWADVAVSAAGSTCWEMAFLGLPALLLVTAENQGPVAAGVDAAGAAINLGWHHTVSPEHLADALSALCRDPVLRAAQCRAGQRLVDGRGADRVVDAMLNADAAAANGRLRLRRA